VQASAAFSDPGRRTSSTRSSAPSPRSSRCLFLSAPPAAPCLHPHCSIPSPRSSFAPPHPQQSSPYRTPLTLTLTPPHRPADYTRQDPRARDRTSHSSARAAPDPPQPRAAPHPFHPAYPSSAPRLPALPLLVILRFPHVPAPPLPTPQIRAPQHHTYPQPGRGGTPPLPG